MAIKALTLRFLGGDQSKSVAIYTLNAQGTVELKVLDPAFQYVAEQPMKIGAMDTRTRKTTWPTDGEAFLDALLQQGYRATYDYV